MHQALLCPGCGQPLPGDAPRGLCPACLIRLAKDSVSQQDADAHIGQEVCTFQADTGGHRNAVCSPDRRWLSMVGLDRSVKVWDVPTGHEAVNIPAVAGYVRDLAFSPDGQRLVSGSLGMNFTDGTAKGLDWSQCEVKVWDATRGEETLLLQDDWGQAFLSEAEELIEGQAVQPKK